VFPPPSPSKTDSIKTERKKPKLALVNSAQPVRRCGRETKIPKRLFDTDFVDSTSSSQIDWKKSVKKEDEDDQDDEEEKEDEEGTPNKKSSHHSKRKNATMAEQVRAMEQQLAAMQKKLKVMEEEDQHVAQLSEIERQVATMNEKVMQVMKMKQPRVPRARPLSSKQKERMMVELSKLRGDDLKRAVQILGFNSTEDTVTLDLNDHETARLRECLAFLKDLKKPKSGTAALTIVQKRQLKSDIFRLPQSAHGPIFEICGLNEHASESVLDLDKLTRSTQHTLLDYVKSVLRPSST